MSSALGRAEPTARLEGRAPKNEDVALIMYTSGSTGAPRGVVITHANLVASLDAVQVRAPLVGGRYVYCLPGSCP